MRAGDVTTERVGTGASGLGREATSSLGEPDKAMRSGEDEYFAPLSLSLSLPRKLKNLELEDLGDRVREGDGLSDCTCLETSVELLDFPFLTFGSIVPLGC
jgi:hypothetical protein